jgi:hypothetical protein
MRPKHVLVATGAEWREYPRIAPGVYRAYSAVAKFHYDKSIGRWVCFVRWDVLTDGLQLIARIPLWWNLGGGQKPRASHRSKYLKEWVRANGGPPARGDRLSPNVFAHRMAQVQVGDTDPNKSAVPYSVVRKIIEWETGASPGHSVNQSHSQGRHSPDATTRKSYGK